MTWWVCKKWFLAWWSPSQNRLRPIHVDALGCSWSASHWRSMDLKWPASPGVSRATECLAEVDQCPFSFFFFGSDGRRSPRVYVSLSISWLLRCSGCDLWPTFRPTCAQLWEVLHVSRLNRLLARWLGGGGLGGGSGFGGGWGGCNNVLSTTFLMVFVILQHPTSNIQHALDATLWHLILLATPKWTQRVTQCFRCLRKLLPKGPRLVQNLSWK